MHILCQATPTANQKFARFDKRDALYIHIFGITSCGSPCCLLLDKAELHISLNTMSSLPGVIAIMLDL